MSILSVVGSMLKIGGEMPGVVGLVSHVLSAVYSNIYQGVVKGQKMTMAEINDWWAGFDARTGLEGVDILRDLPQEAEEKLLDGVKAIGEVLMAWAYGHYGDRPSPATIKASMDNLAAVLSFGDVPAADPPAADPPGDNGSAPAGSVLVTPPDIFDVLQLSLDRPNSMLQGDRLRAMTMAILDLNNRLKSKEAA